MKTNQAKQDVSCRELLKQLKDQGTPQNIKIFRNHGVSGEVYGVSYAFFKKLDKRVADDQQLAEELWVTGIFDARIFACWKAEPHKVTHKLLDAWAREVDNHVLAYELAGLAAYTDIGAARSRKWRALRAEWRSAMGWGILSRLAMQPDRKLSEGGVDDAELAECLETIEANIQSCKNRTRQNMNQALIAIGCRSSMTKAALKVAKRVGTVEVDQGATSCKTDVAYDKIKKTVAHYKSKGKKPTDGAGGQRRRHC